MNKEERITYEEFMTMFKNAPRIAYMLYDKAENEIDRLIYIISETSKHIQHELSHLKANDEVSWNEEFYTNNKLDYRKLCIALLEQVVNKLQGVDKDEN